MTTGRNAEYLVGLIRERRKLPHESEWIEFKGKNSAPQNISEYLSTLANAAALIEKAFAHLVRRVENKAHCPAFTKKGNGLLEAVTNTSIRERFGIEERNSALASRMLNETVDDGMIVVRDPSVGTKSRSYIPYWAAPNLADPVGLA